METPRSNSMMKISARSSSTKLEESKRGPSDGLLDGVSDLGIP